jgi:hypothetical protein
MNVIKALEILGLKRNATSNEIKLAYRDLAKVWHPDRFPNDLRLRQRGEETLKIINEAYQTLQSYGLQSEPGTDQRPQAANQAGRNPSPCLICGKPGFSACWQCWDFLADQFPSRWKYKAILSGNDILKSAVAIQGMVTSWNRLLVSRLEVTGMNPFKTRFDKGVEGMLQSFTLFDRMKEASQEFPRAIVMLATISIAQNDMDRILADDTLSEIHESARALSQALTPLHGAIATALQEEECKSEETAFQTQALLRKLTEIFEGWKPILKSLAVAHALHIYAKYLVVTSATNRAPVAVAYCEDHWCHHLARPHTTSNTISNHRASAETTTVSKRQTGSENVGAWLIGIALAIGLFSVVMERLTANKNSVGYVVDHPTTQQNAPPQSAEPNETARPQNEPPAVSTSYLCNLASFRKQMIEDEIDQVEQRHGDEFDKDAARKRVQAIPDATLEAQRQEALAFTRKVYRDARKSEVCPQAAHDAP